MADHDHTSGSTLEPPRTSIDDPGAHELSSDDEHFSDAQTGMSDPLSPSRPSQKDPLKITPVVLKSPNPDQTHTPGGLPIPKTVVEKIDPEVPSHGEVPGTAAHEKRLADAVPDVIVPVEDHAKPTISPSPNTPGGMPIPITRVERVDAEPSYGEVPGTDSYEQRKEDAEPDILAVKPEESPTSPRLRSPRIGAGHARRRSSGFSRKISVGSVDIAHGGNQTEDAEEQHVEDQDDFGDDFDDFEEGEEDADFGDFGHGFQEPPAMPSQASQPVLPPLPFPILDFQNLSTVEEIRAAMRPQLDSLYPPDSIDTTALPPLTAPDPIFQTPRSASLWAQLVAPHSLQPPNWIRSRIRRLFLVSLGVPVDLDEILPASKQKKLVLPSINLRSSPRSSSEHVHAGGGSTTANGVARLKKSGSNNSTTSVDSQGSSKNRRSESRRRKGPPPPPVLDIITARLLCNTTEQALFHMDVNEIQTHIKKLDALQLTAGETLNYWVKRTDERIGDREAFEAVIENLVKHARKVRK